MIGARILSLAIVCGTGGFTASAADFANYRGLQFGMSVAAAAKQAGTSASDATSLHQRPALIQQLEWQPRSPVRADQAKADPVKEGLLSFVNGQLFRIVVTYDRYKVEGMTADDMIQGISATYGTPTMPTGEVDYHSIYGETAPILARWENSDYSYNLVRSGDHASYAMVLYSKRLEAVAQAAIVESARLDAQEAPLREAERQKKRDADDQLALDKARLSNKPNFRP